MSTWRPREPSARDVSLGGSFGGAGSALASAFLSAAAFTAALVDSAASALRLARAVSLTFGGGLLFVISMAPMISVPD